MKRPAVLVDIDDTIADAQTTLMEHVNRTASRTYTLSDLTRASREDELSEYAQHVRVLLSETQVAESYLPYQDALAAMRLLHEEGYDVHIASSRKENMHAITTQWLTKHGFMPYIAEVHPRMSSDRGHDFKVGVAKTVGAIAAFDDTHEVILALSRVVPTVYMMHRPWNQDEAVPRHVIRVGSFAQAVTEFLASRK